MTPASTTTVGRPGTLGERRHPGARTTREADAATTHRGWRVLQEDEVRTALVNVSSLVQADGGDIEFVSLDADQGAVSLRLVVDGATCQECILPRPLLEEISTGILQRTVPEITSVSIEDPREDPNFVPDPH